MTIDEVVKRFSQEAEVCKGNADNYTRNKMPVFAAVCAKEAAEYRQLAEWLMDLEETKLLLKAAVEDFSNIYDHVFDCDGMCDTCPIHGNRDTCDKWVRADEALKLIGGRRDDTDM